MLIISSEASLLHANTDYFLKGKNFVALPENIHFLSYQGVSH